MININEINKHNIDLSTLLPKGHVAVKMENGLLHVTTTHRLSTGFDKGNTPLNSYVYLPDNYKLPLRIDLTIKIDSPGLYLFFENGHLNFGTPWSDNLRIDDIIEPNHKPRLFHNHIPMNEFVNISIIYDLKEMQILVNGEERFYSKKEKYMKSKLLIDLNSTGFMFKIACSKRTELYIKSLCITEYEEAAEIVHKNEIPPKLLTANEAAAQTQKPVFLNCISLLPKVIHDEVVKTDAFLGSLKPMKFKRVIEKHGNKITYLASEYGFSYAVYPSNDVMYHSLSWYIITSSKPELWHRKADMMEETLNKIAETSPGFAERLFFNLKECIYCSPRCKVKTLYEFNGKKKLTCHGKMEFKMCVSDFDDVRAFINIINDIIINLKDG